MEVEGEQDKLHVGAPKMDAKFLVQSLLLSVTLTGWGAQLVKIGLALLTSAAVHCVITHLISSLSSLFSPSGCCVKITAVEDLEWAAAAEELWNV